MQAELSYCLYVYTVIASHITPVSDRFDRYNIALGTWTEPKKDVVVAERRDGLNRYWFSSMQLLPEIGATLTGGSRINGLDMLCETYCHETWQTVLHFIDTVWSLKVWPTFSIT